MLVVNRFRVPASAADAFRVELEAARDALAGRPGFVEAVIGRNVDEPELWVLSTRWQHVGAYRRALSAYEVKLTAVPVLSRALDEPSAFEVVVHDDVLNVASARGAPSPAPGEGPGPR